MIGILAAALIAAFLTAWVTPIVLRYAEKSSAVDQPGGRRTNKRPMPRLGGVAIFIGFLVAAVLTVTLRQYSRANQHTWNMQLVGVLVATIFMAVVGLIDDFKDLAAKWQALALVVCGVILFAFGVRIEGVTNIFGASSSGVYNPIQSWHALPGLLSLLVTIIWVFVVTKTVDAIDGIDGLASGVCAISAATLALMAVQLRNPQFATLALIAAALVGACLGFLRHNYHPAKIIMGTVGAWVLGTVLSAVSILGAFKVAAAFSVFVPVLVLGVPIFDYIHVLARRLMDRAPLTQADRRHLHHRLMDRGWNQRQVVWFIYSVALVLCIFALALFKVGRPGH